VKTHIFLGLFSLFPHLNFPEGPSWCRTGSQAIVYVLRLSLVYLALVPLFSVGGLYFFFEGPVLLFGVFSRVLSIATEIPLISESIFAWFSPFSG
jgi:hypothetical protein